LFDVDFGGFAAGFLGLCGGKRQEGNGSDEREERVA
jgi:hypothetical protein